MAATIFLDLDGVCADFVKGICNTLGRQDLLDNWQDWPRGQFQLDKLLGITNDELWSKIGSIDGEHEFWDGLDPYPWFPRLYAELKSLAPVYFLSSPTQSPESVSGKLAWLQRFFGEPFRDYIFTAQKQELASPDAILIDDHDENITKWAEHGGIGVVFPQPWNTAEKHWAPYDEAKVDHVLDEVLGKVTELNIEGLR